MTAAERRALVAATLAEVAALKVQNAPALRTVRRRLSAKLKHATSEDVKAVGLELMKAGRRWMGCEITAAHRGAMDTLTCAEVEAFGAGMASWDEVDAFGMLLSGAAWLTGRISDAEVKRWARDPDLWWRRAALVSTVTLNAKSRGGRGDTRRTLMIAAMLVEDHEDMIVKAMSWALRSLVAWDAAAVKKFLARHEDALAARVKREVRNKLRTGLKTPRRS